VTTTLAAGCATVAAAAVIATPASAVIVPQRSIAGVRLSMKPQQVRLKLGQPDKTRHPRSDIFGRYTSWYYGRTRVDMFRGGNVFNVTTTSPSQKTSSGAGVGSTEADVRAGVRHVRCRTEFGHRHCSVGMFSPGRTVTDFQLSPAGVVTRVTLGYVID
jgi:hypothetical protein